MTVSCLVALPWLVVFLRLENFDVTVIASVFEPKEQFASPFRGVLDGWAWSRPRLTSRPLSPETQLFLVATLAGIAWLYTRRRRRPFRTSPGSLFLLVTLAAGLFLQLPVSAGVYELVPGFRFIQFPWRLMDVTQALALLVIGWGIEQIAREGRGRVAIAVAASFLALAAAASRGFRPLAYGGYPPPELERVPAPRSEQGVEQGAVGSGEYLPMIRLAGEDPRRRGLPRRKRYREALPWLRETAFLTPSGCTHGPTTGEPGCCHCGGPRETPCRRRSRVWTPVPPFERPPGASRAHAAPELNIPVTVLAPASLYNERTRKRRADCVPKTRGAISSTQRSLCAICDCGRKNGSKRQSKDGATPWST